MGTRFFPSPSQPFSLDKLLGGQEPNSTSNAIILGRLLLKAGCKRLLGCLENMLFCFLESIWLDMRTFFWIGGYADFSLMKFSIFC